VTTDIGGELRGARERLNLSLPELSRRTKIGMSVLQAIERNDWNLVPGGLYVRGFLRAYAQEVGCNPEDIVNRYRAEYDSSSAETAADQSIAALQSACPPGQLHSSEIDALILTLGGALYLFLGWNSGRATASNNRNAPARVESDAGSAAPTEPSVATAGTKPPDASELRLDIQARESCWLTGTADGQRVVNGMVDAGSHTTIEAHKDVVLRVGDPAKVSYTINGQAAHLPGAAGETVTVHLTPDNYHDFLGDAPPRAAPRPPQPPPDAEPAKPEAARPEPAKPEAPKPEPPKPEPPKPEPPRPAVAEPAPERAPRVPVEVAPPEPAAPEPAPPEPPRLADDPRPQT
jgi:transcriptional regulator with XRE-family HTH domain